MLKLKARNVNNKHILCALSVIFWASAVIAKDSDIGQRVYDKWCIHCHAAGPGNPGTQRLALDRGADKAVITARNDLPFAYIREVVRTGLKEMPSFRHTEISDVELDALGEYLNAIR